MPQLPVAMVVGASLASIVAFLYLIDHLGRWLRPVSVVSQVGRDGARVIESIYPRFLSESREEPGRPAALEGLTPRQMVPSPAGGVVLAFDAAGLVDVARAVDAVIELVPQVGDFVAEGRPALPGPGQRRDPGRGAPAPAHRTRRGADHRAGPGLSVPHHRRHRLEGALPRHQRSHHRGAGPRPAPPPAPEPRHPEARHRPGPRPGPAPAARLPDTRLGGLRRAAVTEIRQFGATSIQVARRLRAMLEDLIAALPPERRPHARGGAAAPAAVVRARLRRPRGPGPARSEATPRAWGTRAAR